LDQPPFEFVLAFLVFSGIFLNNSYKLWFKTDMYYQDIYNSLIREPSLYPFREFFLKRMENKVRWILWQKVFSILGLIAVIVADILVVMAWIRK
jgi:hypothetical protein